MQSSSILAMHYIAEKVGLSLFEKKKVNFENKSADNNM